MSSGNAGNHESSGGWLGLDRGSVVAVAVLAVPVLVSLAGALTHRSTWQLQTEDEAVLEARLLTLWDSLVLVGPYSRHEWHHPGPLQLWLLGAPYHLLRREPLVLPLVMIATTTAALASIVRSVLRLAPSLLSRAVGLALVAVLLAEVGVTRGPSGLSSTWNPVCTLLPYVAFTFLSAELACGAWRLFPVVVLLHAFVAQTHVAYVLPASTALVLASGLASRASWPRERSDRRALALGCGSFVFAWSPVAYDQLFGSGNLGWLVSFFLREEAPGGSPTPTTAALLFAWRVTEALRGALTPWGTISQAGGPVGEASTAALALAVLFTAGVLAILARGAFGRGALGAAHVGSEAQALARLCLVQLVVGGLSLRRVDNVDHPYLTWWLSALGTTSVLSASTLLLQRSSSQRAERVARALALGVVALVTCRTSLEIVARTRAAEEQALGERRRHERYFAVLEQTYARRPDTRLDVAEHELWRMLAASLVHLGRRGVRAHVDPRWEFMFGPAYVSTDETAELELAMPYDRRCRDVGGAAMHLVDCASEAGVSVVATPVPLTVTPSGALGARGDLAWLVDGVLPPDGAPWDSPGSVQLEGDDAGVTLVLPVARLGRLVVHSDDNDVLFVSTSLDGERFEPLTEVPPTHRFGQRAHALTLPGIVARALRIEPRAGDGLYSISEVAIEGVLETVRVVDARGASGPITHLTDGVFPPPGAAWDDPSALRFDGPSPAVTVELPAIPVEGVTLVADHNESYRVEVSSDGVRFEELGTIPPDPDAGLQARSAYFDRDRAVSFVRFTVLEGDGAASIAEIVPRVIASHERAR